MPITSTGSWFLDGFVDQRERETVADGLRALIRQFMADNTDETDLPADLYNSLNRWFSDYMDEDLDELIQDTLDDIEAAERGRRTFTRYYSEDED